MFGQEFPELLENVLGYISEKEQFTDFRVACNKNGTSVVLRYSHNGSSRHSPQWGRRSPVNVARDQTRQNAWFRDHNICNWSLGDDTTTAMQNDSAFGSTPRQGWNINAPEFIQSNNRVFGTAIDADTQTENTPNLMVDMGTQSDVVVKLNTVGTQCDPIQTKNIGVSCVE
jgi:hypothetical protein